ncbi:alpha/beta hydrolase [Nocardioides pacificus]
MRRADVSGTPRGVVLMLHGGLQHSDLPVDLRSASFLRTAAMHRVIAGRVRAAGVSAWLLRHRVRGWNDGDPVPDARWALEEVRRAHGAVPVVLLGHSMGGRTAVHVADDASVVGVVGLAPWWAPGETVRTLAGRHLVGAHGTADEITSPIATRAYVERALSVAASAAFQDMGPVGHYLLKGVRAWNDVAVSRSLALLTD